MLVAIAGSGCAPANNHAVDDSPERSAGAQAQMQGYAKDSVIVRFRATPALSLVRGLATRVNGTSNDRNQDGVDDGMAHIANGELALIRLGGQVSVDAALEELRKDPAVRYAERNHVLRTVAAPNDARFADLYGLHNTGQTGGTPDADIDALEAWSITVGSADIVVGVIDTGVDYRHEDLAANMWRNPGEIPGNSTDDDGNGVIDDVHGFNAIDGSGDPFDDHNHGTHTAGTIGAIGDNGVGLAGVSWNTRIMPIKFLNSEGFGTTADAIRAIDYAVAQTLAGVNLRVLSNSWGGDDFNQALLDAITAAGEAGMLFVAAAGNASSNTDALPHYPASYRAPNLVSVAATDHHDGLAWFSNYGATSVDLGAPGTEILSTAPGHSYQFLSGTSMATPHVAGVAALALSVNPTLTADELKDLLLTSADPLPSLAGVTASGRRLNAASAVAQAGPAAPRFALSVGSPRRVIAQEQVATYPIGVRSILEFAGDVQLTVQSEPAIDAVVTLTPVVSAPGTATLTVTTSQQTAIGSYDLTITGASGALTVSRSVTLDVLAAGTRFALRVAPSRHTTQQGNGAIFQVTVEAVGGFTGEVSLGVSSQPPFPGSAFLVRGVVTAPGTSTLQINSDCTTRPGEYVFTVVAAAEGTTASAPAALRLEPFGTTIVTVPSADTPLAIPDGDPAGVSSAVDVGDDLVLDEVSVMVDIAHTFIGDLVVQLVGPDGTRVTLHDRGAGDGDDLRRSYTVRDFAGLTSTGRWQLLVSDHSASEIGTLTAWELNLRGRPRSFPPFANFDVSPDGANVEFFDNSFGTGCGGGAPIVSRFWDLGDGATSTEMNPRHTYAGLGDYVVTLTVTDQDGLTGSTQQTVAVTRPPPVLSIVGVTRNRARRTFRIDLRWTGAEGRRIELYRNSAPLGLLTNDGRHRDVFSGAETSYRWFLCEQLGLCSNEVSIDFGPDAEDNQATIRTQVGGKQIVKTIAVEEEVSPTARRAPENQT
jgi:subtilisin family serine protease/subtilisin-like proprotein convertase family protein